MIIKLLNILTVVLLTSTYSFGQDGNVEGTIKTADGKPANHVKVTINASTKEAVTDRHGNYFIPHVEPGNYTLVTTSVGLETKEQTVEVKAGETARLDFELTENAYNHDEVVIAGQSRYKEDQPSSSLRINTPVLEVPQNIQIVTNHVIKDQQIISMSDGLTRNVSGLVRMEHWGDLYTNITARGSQIQAFRNGFNVVNSYWGPLTEDMSFVDHIEFVKGPAGFMLSSGDPSGLYNVATKKPTGQNRGEVTLTAGSFNLYRASLDLDGKISNDGRLLARLNVSAQNKGSFRPNEYNNRYAIAPVISYQLDEKTKLTFEYNYQRANMSNLGSYYVFSPNGFADYPVESTMLPAGIPGTKIDDHSFYANIQHSLNKRWKITAQLGHFIYNQVGSSMWPSTVNADGTIIRNISIWDAQSKMTMGQLFINGDVITGPIRHRILGGLDVARKSYLADWSQGHDLDTAGGEFNPRDPNLGVPNNGYPNFDRSLSLEERANIGGGNQDMMYSSIYLQDELGFFENRLRLTLAGRYTDLQQSSFGGDPEKAQHFTPRVGLSVSLNKQTAVYALYDQAFVPQTGVLSSGAKVKPITGENIEFGIKKDWFGGQWNTTLAVYNILKRHELVADPNHPPSSGLSVELGSKRAQGLEFDLRGTIVKGLNLIANYAYTDSRVLKVADGVTSIKAGDVVPGYAKHTMNAWLSYKIQSGVLKGVGASAGCTGLVDRKTYWELPPNGNNTLADYFKVDGGLFWENDKLKITANVFNVFNTYLYSGSYYGYLNAYYWQADAPRNVRVSLAYRF